MAQRALNPQPLVEADSDAVDDWFESASFVSDPHEMPQWQPDEVTPTDVVTNPFQDRHFRPIANQNAAGGDQQPQATPLIVTDDEQAKRSKTSRMSESDVFIRTPEPEAPRTSTPRSVTSPTTKKQPSNSLSVTTPPFVRSMMQSLLPSAISEAGSVRVTPTGSDQSLPNGSTRQPTPE